MPPSPATTLTGTPQPYVVDNATSMSDSEAANLCNPDTSSPDISKTGDSSHDRDNTTKATPPMVDLNAVYSPDLLVTDPDGITVGMFRENMEFHIVGPNTQARPRLVSQNQKRSLNEKIPKQPPSPLKPLPPAPIEVSVELETITWLEMRYVTPGQVVMPPPPNPMCGVGYTPYTHGVHDRIDFDLPRMEGGELSEFAVRHSEFEGVSFTPLESWDEVKRWYHVCCMQ
ncbi:hypothetical protein V8D89_006639 [Ganoderma adspersum]